MGKYAVVEILGKQYKVEEGKELLVDTLGKPDGEVIFDKVLLLVDDGKIKFGTPIVSGAQIKAKVLGEEKGKKIYVIKFRAKSRYRRKIGFRSHLTHIKIEEIREKRYSSR